MEKIKKYNYDKESDSLLINIKEGEEDRFEEVVPGVNLELNKNGEIIGVEILKASRFISENLTN
tara:strand:+ start:2197 stop:2388 length:192 start_codon:yes stop_codon:yes gene_type:complete